MNERVLMLMSVGLLLIGCITVGDDYRTKKYELAESYKRQGFVNSAELNEVDRFNESQISKASATGSLWQLLDDATLQYLLTLAVAENKEVKRTFQSLLLAKTVDHDSTLDLLPQPITTFKGEEKRDSQRRSFPAENGGKAYQDYNLSQSFTWELDWVGRLKRLNESTKANVMSLEAQLALVRLVLRSEVVRQYCIARGTQVQLNATQGNAERQKETWQLTQSRFDAGVATPVDVARAKSQYYATLSRVPPLEQTLKRAFHRLAVLSGQSGSMIYDLLRDSAPIPQFPKVSPMLLEPSNVLERRPDVLVAEANVRKAVADVGVSKALWYPQITVLGDLGFGSDDIDQLSDGASVFSLLGFSVRWAGLGFKRVQVLVNRSQIEADIAYTEYQRTVLAAFEEVENALVNYKSTLDIRQHLNKSVEAAKVAAGLAQQRYEGGVIGFIEVLDAERRQLEIENELASAQTNAALAMVDLYLSLAVD